MNLSPKLLMVAAMMSSVPILYAQSVVEVEAPDDGGVTSVPLTLGTKITFSKTGFEISDGASVTDFLYARANRITFKTSGSGVESVMPDSELRLKKNPVGSMLEFAGHNGVSARLSVVSLSGQTMVSIPEWNGEDIDVSTLSPGLYIITLNNNNLKFIKK